MSNRWVLFIVFAVLAFVPLEAAAAVVNYSGTDYDMGLAVAGNEGFIQTETSGTAFDKISGVLPTQTKITFTYTTAHPYYYLSRESLVSNGSFTIGSDSYSFFGDAGSSRIIKGGKPVSSVEGFSFESVRYVDTRTGGSTWVNVITNLTGADVNFLTRLSSLLAPSGVLSSGYYKVESIAPVPLPAALPLFGMGLAGIAAAYRRKK